MTVIHRLTGVYHADGGIRGEVAYAIGKLIGTAHCALCDITHRGLSPKRSWTGLTASLRDIGVPFEVVHLNERDPQVVAACDGGTPCVLAHTDGGLRQILGPAELDAVHGDVAAFAAALRDGARTAGLTWPDDAWANPPPPAS